MSPVALLGFGRFGRALAGLLIEAGLDFRALDPQAEVPPRHAAGSLSELVDGAEIVVAAVPVDRLEGALRALRPHLGGSHTVLDVGSVKVRPAATMQQVLGEEVPHVATHPLFGPSSLARAERPLRVVVCPGPIHPAAAVRARQFYQRLGCEVVEQTAEVHDRVMACTHALTFFLARGMLEAGMGEEVPFSPPSFQAVARAIEAVRADAGHLFQTIQRDNPYAAQARLQLLGALASVDRALRQPPEGADAAEIAIPDLGTRSPELREAREHIDAVDRELLALLRRRTDLARRAARAKVALGHPVLDGTREVDLLAGRRAWAAETGLDPDGVEEIFRAILRLSRRVQQGGA